jgi:hypothetical protein
MQFYANKESIGDTLNIPGLGFAWREKYTAANLPIFCVDGVFQFPGLANGMWKRNRYGKVAWPRVGQVSFYNGEDAATCYAGDAGDTWVSRYYGE